MVNIILLLVCLATGMLLRYYRLVPEKSYLLLNELLINLFIPAITFLHIAETRFDSSFLLPVITPWCVYAAAFIFFVLYAKKKKLAGEDTGTLILTGGISSISFVGFPVFEMLYGKPGLQAGIMMSQAGTFLICSTLGVITASYFGAKKISLATMFKNIFLFPPFIAFAVSVILHFFNYRHPVAVKNLLEKISSPFAIIALISVGLKIEVSKKMFANKLLLTGLFFKLLLAPFFVFVAMMFVFGRIGMTAEICILGAAIGSMNTVSILVYRFKLNQQLAAQMIAVGIPLSLPLVYIFHLLIQKFFA